MLLKINFAKICQNEILDIPSDMWEMEKALFISRLCKPTNAEKDRL